VVFKLAATNVEVEVDHVWAFEMNGE